MLTQDLTYVLQHPEAITAVKFDTLSSNIKKYPYFQALRALHLKSLKQKESYRYNHSLKVTAAHTTDRSVLFDYITSEVFNQNEISQHINQHLQAYTASESDFGGDSLDDGNATTDTNLNALISATEGVLDPDLFEAKPITSPDGLSEAPKIEDSILSIDVDNITPEQHLQIGKPLEFNVSENHSFTEWLKITSFKPIQRNASATETKTETEIETQTKTGTGTDSKLSTRIENRNLKSSPPSSPTPLSQKLALIDKFISENPKIKPVSGHASKPKLVNNDDAISEHLMTETLARIYLEQKNYDKAIQSYKILSLKYPEKSSFFAHQIKLVNELKDFNTQ